MKKFIPNIIIYRLELMHNETGYVIDSYNFLFYWSMRRFIKRHEKQLRDECKEFNCKLVGGGEPLRLWW